MAGTHGIDHQHTQALSHLGGGYARVVVDGVVVKHPLDVERQITGTDQAVHGNRILEVCRHFAKVKVCNFGATSDIDWEGYNNLGFSKQNYEIKTIIINIVGT